MNNNQIKIIGEIKEMDGLRDFAIGAKRFSGFVDIAMVHTNQDYPELSVGMKVEVIGSIHTYNKIENDKSRLIVHVLADSVNATEHGDMNETKFDGYVTKPAVFRVTPNTNREIAELLITVNDKNGNSFIPCIAWGKNAHSANKLKVGETISIIGRLQSREYQKNTQNGKENRVAYEVSIINFTPNGEVQNVQ